MGMASHIWQMQPSQNRQNNCYLCNVVTVVALWVNEYGRDVMISRIV